MSPFSTIHSPLAPPRTRALLYQTYCVSPRTNHGSTSFTLASHSTFMRTPLSICQPRPTSSSDFTKQNSSITFHSTIVYNSNKPWIIIPTTSQPSHSKTQTATAQPQAATPGLLLGFPHVISSITLPPNCITTSNKRWIIILQNLRASRASRNSSGRRPPRHRWLTSSSDFLK